jgi:SnoaL-like domain
MTFSAADRLDILELITRADDAATRRDADSYAALFTPDAVLDGTQGTHPAARLRDAVGSMWAAEGPATLHLALNPVIAPGRSADEVPNHRCDNPDGPPRGQRLANHQAHHRPRR